jgi:hypothetical protein
MEIFTNIPARTPRRLAAALSRAITVFRVRELGSTTGETSLTRPLRKSPSLPGNQRYPGLLTQAYRCDEFFGDVGHHFRLDRSPTVATGIWAETREPTLALTAVTVPAMGLRTGLWA